MKKLIISLMCSVLLSPVYAQTTDQKDLVRTYKQEDERQLFLLQRGLVNPGLTSNDRYKIQKQLSILNGRIDYESKIVRK